MVRVGIIGGAGYTGGELIRILLQHPKVTLVFVQSSSNAGNPLYQVHADLLGDTELHFIANHHFEVDVLFFCAGHGEAKKFVLENSIPDTIKLIDIGNDFRLQQDATIGNRTFVYGLPEINKAAIQSAQNIANPGCFATAIQLGLLPLANAGLLTDAYVTGITGSTGAGQGLSSTSHFSWRANNIQPYKTLQHQHLGEITESLVQLANQPNFQPQINFVPWRGDFTRGIFVSSTLKIVESLASLQQLYKAFYADAVFTLIAQQPIFLKQVVNTNKCLIQLEKVADTLVVHSTIDNLLKGASGQAVQNLNLLFGWEENTGLRLKSNYF